MPRSRANARPSIGKFDPRLSVALERLNETGAFKVGEISAILF
jgi:hypothetical protein